jgi:hypothetical protein
MQHLRTWLGSVALVAALAVPSVAQAAVSNDVTDACLGQTETACLTALKAAGAGGSGALMGAGYDDLGGITSASVRDSYAGAGIEAYVSVADGDPGPGKVMYAVYVPPPAGPAVSVITSGPRDGGDDYAFNLDDWSPSAPNWLDIPWNLATDAIPLSVGQLLIWLLAIVGWIIAIIVGWRFFRRTVSA